MKAKRSIIAVLCLGLLLSWSDPLLGQADTVNTVASESDWYDWNVRLSPFIWILGIKGQVAIDPDPVQLPEIPPPIDQLPSGYKIYDIDLSFRDISNSLKFALLLSGQFHVKGFVSRFNISSIVLESNAETPFDYFFQDNTVRLAYAGGDLGAGYRVVKSKKVEFDVMAGLKFIYTKVGLQTSAVGELPIEVNVSRFWTDPVIATIVSYRPHKRIELMAYGDLGYTLLNDNLTYQFSTDAKFFTCKLFYISLGYRKYYFDFTAKEAFFAGSLQGMLVKFGFQF